MLACGGDDGKVSLYIENEEKVGIPYFMSFLSHIQSNFHNSETHVTVVLISGVEEYTSMAARSVLVSGC